MSDRRLVLSFFPEELAAENATVALKDSGIADGDAFGILALGSNGTLNARYRPRRPLAFAGHAAAASKASSVNSWASDAALTSTVDR
jgi:hypothetical protein